MQKTDWFIFWAAFALISAGCGALALAGYLL
jgi:hypothetical protein